MSLSIDDRPGDGENAESLGQLRKFCSLDAIGADKVAFHGELVSQAHGRRAMRSGGCGENLQVKRLRELGQLLAAFRLQSRIAL